MSRREEILESAFEVLADDGLESVHARTVAAKIGVNHATVHYYFPQRVDLLAGLADHVILKIKEDRESLGGGSKRRGIESDLALISIYCRSGNRMGRALLGIFAASTNDQRLRDKSKGIWEMLAGDSTSKLAESRLRKSSPYLQPDLYCSTLLGILIAAQVSDQTVNPAEMLDTIHESMFKD